MFKVFRRPCLRRLDFELEIKLPLKRYRALELPLQRLRNWALDGSADAGAVQSPLYASLEKGR